MPVSDAEIKLVTEIYAAINRNDVAALVQAFDPQIERVEPTDFPSAGTYRGHAELSAHIAKGRGTWAEGGCEVDECIVAGDTIVVFVHVHVRLKDRTEWIDGRMADVFTFRDGKAVFWRSFGKRQDALDWASAQPIY
jgi:ketosteroid isomerase-like protein